MGAPTLVVLKFEDFSGFFFTRVTRLLRKGAFMKRSLLLHALSVNDRMLEPNDLPLYGQVWAYAKDNVGREAFVGHCLTMLSLLGMQASDISWQEDIMAFDAKGRDGPYTIIISLEDDSLASRHFYFLGVWQKKDVSSLQSFKPAALDADLLQADLHFEVLFSDGPMQMQQYARLLSGELFGEQLYDGNFALVSNADLASDNYARFVISPKAAVSGFPRAEVRHILYSLRNLMALTAATFRIYKKLWADDSEVALYRGVTNLMRRSRAKDVDPGEWDVLVTENAAVLLQAAELEALRAKLSTQVDGLQSLFGSILNELHSMRLTGMAPLWPRLQLPFEHTIALMQERRTMRRRSEKQAELLLQLLHSRMLAGQQTLLAALLDQCKT